MLELSQGHRICCRLIARRSNGEGQAVFYYHPGRGTPAAGKPMRLPNDPQSPQFWAEYARLSGAPIKPLSARVGTFLALLAAYRTSPEFLTKGNRTRVLNERHMRLIEQAWGPLQVRGLRAKHVLELCDSLSDRHAWPTR